MNENKVYVCHKLIGNIVWLRVAKGRDADKVRDVQKVSSVMGESPAWSWNDHPQAPVP